MEVKAKRKDILILIFSVILLGVQISLISNILFDKYYKDNIKLFVLIIIVLLLLNIFLIINIMIKYEIYKKEIELKFVYDYSKKKFIDIPFNSTSVNARVLFDNLPEKHKDKIYYNIEERIINGLTEDNLESHKQFFHFIDCFLIQLIFTRILKGRIQRDKKKKYFDIDINYLKELLVKFRYIDVDEMLGVCNSISIGNIVLKSSCLSLPEGFNIKKVEKNNIRLESKYGFIYLKWDSCAGGVSQETKMISEIEGINLDECNEITVNLSLEYGFKPLKLFKSSTVEFEDFIKVCEQQMVKFDKSTTVSKYKLKLMHELSRKVIEKSI
ncbi:hypothetical protein [Clostridium aquiflavi]|uniref:Uncharacterized protein n=1 Tax=Clostridium aquiflavi TaxID=3073603 RepID=A0ABU1EIK0_9CLOT|nr:hypothetical protein [Clostridium sp. 5N-1]MDR5587897.1 hypothetical protein [Clostridium sp. 5N-1]